VAENKSDILARLDELNEQELRRLLAMELTKKPLGLVWERDAIEEDRALNANVVLPRIDLQASRFEPGNSADNLIIEGDNFDSLRLLRKTHAGKIRVIYIDPPYNTGTKDWIYSDQYVKKTDRFKNSKWLEFLYQRMTIARDLLTSDGVIMISINDENRSYLELLMDQVMPGRKVGSMVWKKRRSSNASGVEHFFSTDHEHVLIYAGPAFNFKGRDKDWSKYNQWDEVAQDWWTSTQLTLGFNRYQRKNLFYPLHNPAADIWYPCDPDRVWARASKSYGNVKSVRTEYMEELIARNGVSFPEEKNPAYYQNVEEIEQAIRNETAPPHLSKQDDLNFWVGKHIGRLKPRLKTYKKSVQNQSQPLSSIIAEIKSGGVNEADSDVRRVSSGQTSEGTSVLRALKLDHGFPYPKPLSLIKTLLQQATNPDDIVLDFFAGSGTTGHAVLALNHEDGGSRRFILCSSTEATQSEPDKNICRDICAERIRRVMAGKDGKDGLGGSFAYLTLDLVEEADLDFEGEAAHAHALVALRESRTIHPPEVGDGILVAAQDDSAAVLVCQHVTPDVLERLRAWPAERLVVYSARPDTVRAALEEQRAIESFPLDDAFRRGQTMARTATEEEIA
jgi:adenine-specific DNA-methyltransferase